MTTDAQAKYKLIAWVVTLGAGLLALGYLTAEQWLALVGGLFG